MSSSSPSSQQQTEDADPILEESGLTEEQRRQIRRQQRDLLKELNEQDNLELDEARTRNNEIYKSVRYTREAVLDGENLTLIANKAAQAVDRLIQVPRYDADRLVSKLVEKCRNASQGGSAFFDWAALGKEAGVCFNAIPSGVCFLNGPLTDGAPPVVRKVAQRRKAEEEDDQVEEKPENVQGHTNRDADQLSAIEQSMKVLQATLKKKVDQQYRENKKRLNEAYNDDIPKHVDKKLRKHGVEVDGVQYLFNPDSFTQTVENIFAYSFLVKKGSASIAVREKAFNEDGMLGKPGPVVKYTDEKKKQNPPRQAIVALTMKSWRELCQAYEVTKGDLPHRTGSKHAKRAASLSQTLSQQSSSSTGA